MIPYITNRGGPMVGVEALAMQGLPVDKLLLTRESQDELADLAGNAMSSTVVGSCILAALVVCKDLLKAGDDKETYKMKKLEARSQSQVGDEDAMDVDSTPKSSELPVGERISGVEQLAEQPLDLSKVTVDPVKDVLEHATRSVRLCLCEGRKDITTRELLLCQDCGSSSCKKCAGRPEHNFGPLDVQTVARIPPSAFVRELKSVLPMCLSITETTAELLDSLRSASNVTIPEKRWVNWRSAVVRATSAELRFVELKRQEVWSAVYQSTSASFELYLDPKQTEWRLYAIPLESEPANAEIRRLLQLPVARFKCQGGLLQGRWQFALPSNNEITATVTGSETLVPSWGSRLGLLKEEFRDARVHSHLKVTVPADKVSLLDRDISGTYALLDKCGTACGALHKREATAEDTELPPLFMMLDPTRCGDPKDDAFVFTTAIRRYDYGEFRPIVCKFPGSWRQSDVQGDQSVTCHVPVQWVYSDKVSLQVSLHELYLSYLSDHIFCSLPDSLEHILPFLEVRWKWLSTQTRVPEPLLCCLARCLFPMMPVPNGRVRDGGKSTSSMSARRLGHWPGCSNVFDTSTTIYTHGRPPTCPRIFANANGVLRRLPPSSGARLERKLPPSRIRKRLGNTSAI